MALATKNCLVQNVNSAEVEEPYLLVFYKTINYCELLQTTTEAVAENSTVIPLQFCRSLTQDERNQVLGGLDSLQEALRENLFTFEDIHISYFVSWLLDHFLHLKGRKASFSWVLLRFFS